MHIRENLDIGCREYNSRRPKNYNSILRRKLKTFSKKWHYQTRYKKLGKFWKKKEKDSVNAICAIKKAK